MPPSRPPRRRRSPEAARRAILDAAGARLQQDGPDGLRLQTIAADLGMAHSSILHHFGSRDGLLDALSEDALGALDRDLFATLEAGPGERGEAPAAALLDRVARTLRDQGHARLLAWQIISGRLNAEDEGDRDPNPMLGRIADAVHRVRLEDAAQQGTPAPPLQDTRMFILMITCSLFGEALAGDLFAESLGLSEAGGRETYRDWLADRSTRLIFGAPAEGPPGEARVRDRAGEP